MWHPREVAIATSLLGFPGGFAVAARSLYRLGRRPLAYLHLLAAPALMLAIALPPDLPRGATIALNLGLAGYLYFLLRRQIRAFEDSGADVAQASGGAGVATFVGGWAIALVPVIVLSFLGSQVESSLRGTIEFGTAGSGCTVEARASAFPADEPIHYVAHMSRQLQAGETIVVSVTEAQEGLLGTDSKTTEGVADCLSADIPARALAAGTYTFEIAIGTERLASGQLVSTPP